MASKGLDGYHDNKSTKSKAVIINDSGKLELVPLVSGIRYYGIEIELEFDGENSYCSCSYCDGSGQLYDEDSEEYYECDECGGSGEVRDDDLSRIAENFDIPEEYFNMLVFENDGSLEYGFELITVPMTLDAMRMFLNLPFMVDIVGSSIYGNNGVHIHVSKPHEDVINGVRMVLLKKEEELIDMTRVSGYATWLSEKIYRDFNFDSSIGYAPTQFYLASTGYGGSEHGAILERLQERYLALNVQNSKTIEFRFLKFSNDIDDYMLYLNLIDSTMNVATDYYIHQVFVGDLHIADDWVVSLSNTDKTVDIVRKATKQFNELNDHDMKVMSTERFERMVLRDSVVYEVGDVVRIDTTMLNGNWDKYRLDYCDNMSRYTYGVVEDVRKHHREFNYMVIDNNPNVYSISLMNDFGEKIFSTYSYTSHWLAGKVGFVENQETVFLTVEGE